MLKNKFTDFFFQEIQKITILMFRYLMANNQLKCDNSYKIAMRAGDDKRRIDYEWP